MYEKGKRMVKKTAALAALLFFVCILGGGCAPAPGREPERKEETEPVRIEQLQAQTHEEGQGGNVTQTAFTDFESAQAEFDLSDSGAGASEAGLTVDLDAIPDYSGEPFVIVNGNVPFFGEDEVTTDVFELYSALDELGRCGVAYANICEELMPTEERTSISSVKPSGWQSAKYDTELVSGGWLYNRSHLIGFQLAGENANERNLITGTRYFNVEGMLPFENMVADYVKETDSHVLYRVTPIFEGDNLVASGVLMEALSVEDAGEGIEYCVYTYNVQPGIAIDYATGESWVAQ